MRNFFREPKDRTRTDQLEEELEKGVKTLSMVLQYKYEEMFANCTDDDARQKVIDDLNMLLKKKEEEGRITQEQNTNVGFDIDPHTGDIDHPMLNPDKQAKFYATIKIPDRMIKPPVRLANTLKPADIGDFFGEGSFGFINHIKGKEDLCLKQVINKARYLQEVKDGATKRMKEEYVMLLQAFRLTQHLPARCIKAVAYVPHMDAYIMEKVRGLSLQKIKENIASSNLSDKQAFSQLSRSIMTEHILLTLRTLHHAGILHNDIADRNLMLSEDNKEYVIDFGQGKYLDFEVPRHRKAMIENEMYRANMAIEELFTVLSAYGFAFKE